VATQLVGSQVLSSAVIGDFADTSEQQTASSATAEDSKRRS
jgi:hypothetical protein